MRAGVIVGEHGAIAVGEDEVATVDGYTHAGIGCEGQGVGRVIGGIVGLRARVGICTGAWAGVTGGGHGQGRIHFRGRVRPRSKPASRARDKTDGRTLSMALSPRQRRCHGLCAVGLEDLDGHGVDPATRPAFLDLRAAAAAAGFDLRIASAYRSFERQLTIWNGKLSGERPVLDEEDRPLDLATLGDVERIERVLRFSAMPGASRHHWGTDLDIYDAAAVPPGYRLCLNAAEVADEGPFGPLHRWLDERIADGTSRGLLPALRPRSGRHCAGALASELRADGRRELARDVHLSTGLRAAWREARVRADPVEAAGRCSRAASTALVERFRDARGRGAPVAMTG
jgi:hypothetical protein